jgi:Holliday junction DNA helicase RuvA
MPRLLVHEYGIVIARRAPRVPAVLDRSQESAAVHECSREEPRDRTCVNAKHRAQFSEQKHRSEFIGERIVPPVITQIRGMLRAVAEEELLLGIDPIEVEILIPENARRHLQGRVGEIVTLQTMFYIEGNQMSGRMVPRLVGFLSSVDREFFDTFCSVDGVGVRKALRAMVRPVRELARMIQDQDVKLLATLPGIGEATAERIVAKLRRKVGKFALIVGPSATVGEGEHHTVEANGAPENAEPDVIRDTFAALLSVGHTESQARQAIDRVLAGRKKYKSVADLIDAIYRTRESD